jgi:hypothetical protein
MEPRSEFFNVFIVCSWMNVFYIDSGEILYRDFYKIPSREYNFLYQVKYQALYTET